ncbi:L,D-transpeptidase [Propionibacterium cyclohexanicum]|uniref:L,D-transpeptidase n=1 Tax=Propionibacterium cyclohexanicum TaxID=64702 RepID=UPI001C42EBBA|nr:L,D-transpeptidase [Propionibacterium cyclohexanicum]
MSAPVPPRCPPHPPAGHGTLPQRHPPGGRRAGAGSYGRRIPRAVLVRRWALVLATAIALLTAVIAPFALRSHQSEARAEQGNELTACQDSARQYDELVTRLYQLAGGGQNDLAAGSGDPGTVENYRALYSQVVADKLAPCSAAGSASELSGQASRHDAATSALRAKIDAVATGECPSGASASASCPSPHAATIDWVSPSGGKQPDLSGYRQLSVHVSLADQRVYVMSGSTVIYSMICSSGKGEDTPTGTFWVQNRGESFFNGTEQMGANYWVSWKNYGEFLFHSVPIDKNGNYIVSEALKLGHKASSGCIRLTVDDARWLYEQLPENTTVVIS